ncbi:MAG: replication-relaxation family protein [Thermaerobacter sp.]|nr:replication-relaxation family protein [Thermaerobacter sp.]
MATERAAVIWSLEEPERRVLAALAVLRVMAGEQLARLLAPEGIGRLVAADLLRGGARPERFAPTPWGERLGLFLRGVAPVRRPALATAALPHALAVAEAYTGLEEARRAGKVPNVDWLGPAEAGRLLGVRGAWGPRLWPDAAFFPRPDVPVFLEVDRGKVTLGTLRAKLFDYDEGLGRHPGGWLAFLVERPGRAHSVRGLVAGWGHPAAVLEGPEELVRFAAGLA